MTWQRTLPILATNRFVSSWFSLCVCTVHVCVFTCSSTSLDQNSHRTKDAAYLRNAQKDQKRIIPVPIISARQLILPIAKSWIVPSDIRSTIAHVQYTNGCDILLGYSISSKKKVGGPFAATFPNYLLSLLHLMRPSNPIEKSTYPSYWWLIAQSFTTSFLFASMDLTTNLTHGKSSSPRQKLPNQYIAGKKTYWGRYYASHFLSARLL